METPFRFAEIELGGKRQEERIVGLFRYESDTRQSAGGAGRRGPSLMILADINSSLYVYEQLLDALGEAADAARHLTVAAGSDPMARFEKLIERLNDAVAKFVEQEPNEIAWNRVNIYVIEFNDGRLCLTGLGRLSSALLQRQSDGDFRAYDLLGSLEQPATVNPKKIFSSLLCGDLRVGDLLFVGTNNFDRWRDDIELIERLKTMPPVSAGLEIKQTLEKLNLDEDFAGFIASRSPAPIGFETPSAGEDAASKSTQSINRLYAEERNTDAVLSPATPRLSREAPQEVSARKAKGAGGFSLIKLFAELRSRIKKIRFKRDPLSMASLRGMNAGFGSFLSGDRKRLILIGVGVLLAVGILGGWFYSSRKFKAEQEVWNTALAEATDKKNRAEADLVYGNEDRTRRLIKEAQDLLTSLDERTGERAAAKSKLAGELQDVLNKLKREVVVERPELMASLASDAPEGSLAGVALSNGKVYTFDKAAKELLEIDPSNKDVKRVALPANSTAIVALNQGPSSLLMLGTGKSLLQYANGSVSASSWPTGNASGPTAIVSYNRRAYLLDPAANMIWRYSLSSSALSGEMKYLQQSSANLATATGMAIDSNVYVTWSDGTIKRYLSGAEESWKPVTIEPELKNANGIWTPLESDRVAVADGASKRVVIFRKDGRLVAQITSPEFKGPSAVSGDEQAKKIYVVDANRVYRLDLP